MSGMMEQAVSARCHVHHSLRRWREGLDHQGCPVEVPLLELVSTELM
jgi:hypothetical protein